MFEVWSIYRESGRLNSRLAWNLGELEAQILVEGRDDLIVLTEEEAEVRFQQELHDFFHWKESDWSCPHCEDK